MAVGVLSSSSTWSTLRSISSRRRRISERRSSEVMKLTEARGPGRRGWGAWPARALVGRADQTRPLHSAAVGQVSWFFASPTSPSGRYRLVAQTTPADLFVHARNLFDGANGKTRRPLAPHHCWLTNRIKAPAAINRASRIPATSETTQCRLGLTRLFAPLQDPTRREVCPWRSAPSSALLYSGLTVLATTVNLPTRRAPSPQIRARNTSLDGPTNGRAGINSAPNVDAGINGATHLGGQRCGDHEDRGDSADYRKLPEHKIGPQQGDHGGDEQMFGAE